MSSKPTGKRPRVVLLCSPRKRCRMDVMENDLEIIGVEEWRNI